MDANTVSGAIQLAVAPVFMLTAVASLIGALATRLSRIVDRARDLEDKLEAGTIRNLDYTYWELGRLRGRGQVISSAVGLLALAATFIAGTVMLLFVGETMQSRSESLVPWSFLCGVACFVLALLGLLIETLLASYVLKFGHQIPHKKP